VILEIFVSVEGITTLNDDIVPIAESIEGVNPTAIRGGLRGKFISQS